MTLTQAAEGLKTAPRHARPKDAAQHLGIGLSTLWNWAKHRAGFPKPTKVGERVTLFDLNAIDDFVAAQGAGGAQ